MWSTTSRRAVVAGLFLLAGCGGSSTGTEPEGRHAPLRDLAGVSVSSTQSFTMTRLAGEGVAVIDGTGAIGGDRHLVAHTTIEGLAPSVDRDHPAMAFPSAWSDDGHVYVFGRDCPEPSVPDLGDIDQLPIEEVCGRDAGYSIRTLDLTSGDWSSAPSPVALSASHNAFVRGTAGSVAIISGAKDGRPWLYRYDAATHDVFELGPDGASAASGALFCPVEGGKFAVAVVRLEPGADGDPSAVPEISLLDDGGLQPTHGGDGSPGLGVPAGCGAGSMIFMPSKAGSADLPRVSVSGDGALTVGTVTGPAELAAAADFRALRQVDNSFIAWAGDGEGPMKALWFSPDGDPHQIEVPGRRVDPPRSALVVSDTLLALGGSSTHPTLLVVSG